MTNKPDGLRTYSLVCTYALIILWIIAMFATMSAGPLIMAALASPVAYYLHNSKRNEN